MKTAIRKNQLINIDLLQRDEFQKVYDEGKKGYLSCPVCDEKVRFYLGIHEKPHFYHILNKNALCQDTLHINHAIREEETTEFIERNGFKIPKSRSITTVSKPSEEFKETKTVKSVPPFTQKDNIQISHLYPYLKVLSNNNIFLDSNQMEAVTHTEGPMLVVAGAGSGKTRVLTTRTAFMLTEKNVDPRTVMLVTFTAKSAAEMKERLLTYPQIARNTVQQLVSGTFHSIFYRILAFHAPEVWSSDKLLNKEWQKEQIIKEAGKGLQLDEKEFAYDLALQQIGFWKNSLCLPHQIRPESPWEEKVQYLYKHYEEYKNKQNLFDFDDMLIGCYHLFKNEPALLDTYQNRFQYFLIDEFQDINKIQYELIKMLSAKSKNVCAVGDDDQSIYAFRGSDPQYLLEFEKDFPSAKLVILNENYRSTHEIVSTANRVIEKNKLRRPKQMKAQFSQEKLPCLFFPFDEEEEATMIVNDIQEKISEGYKPEDFAILFRTHTGSRATFERLANSSLPFKIDHDVEPFYERFIVRSMLSFLRLSFDEEDQTAIRNILTSLFLKQSVLQDIKADSILKDCSLLECLATIKTGFAFQERKLKKLPEIVRSLSRLSPLTAIETIEKDLGYQDFVKKRGNEGNKLDKGSDDVRDLKVAAKNFATIRDFLDHVDHMTAMNKEIKALSKKRQDAITLSTIHRAKGLEYKIVYLIGAVDGSLPHEYALESFRNGENDPLEEERRLMYVAITRAKEQLYISVPEKRRGKKAHPSRFLTPIK